MIAAWMFFSIVTGCALTVSAIAFDELASRAGRPQRFVWLGAMVVTTCWPIVALARMALFPVRATADDTAPVLAGVQHLGAFVVGAPAWEIGPMWTRVLLLAWLLFTAASIARLALAVIYIRKLRATWRSVEVDGFRVQVATDSGPALVGLSPMRVVLPEWVLEMERPLRSLVLQHEAEHEAARDPYLLLAAAALTTLVPWNPALWFQARRLRLAIEIDCDARVLRSHPRWSDYAHLLLTIAQRRAGTRQRLVPALSGPTSSLERRITAMRRIPKLSRVQLLCFGAVAAGAFAIACAVDTPASPNRASGARSASVQSKSVVPLPKKTAAPYFEFQVEVPASYVEKISSTPLPEGPKIDYPADLKASGKGATVAAQFVVDESGRVDASTFKALKSTDPRVTAAVKAALPNFRFNPATVGGRKVKQLVQQNFAFVNVALR